MPLRRTFPWAARSDTPAASTGPAASAASGPSPSSSAAVKPRSSTLVRGAWVANVILIGYASLAPWHGWRDLGVSPLAFLTAPLPRYVTTFDLVVNVLGYLPFGVLTMLALHPRLRGIAAWLLTAAASTALAVAMEALQTYLPQRVPALIDVLANTAGAALGALLVAPFVSILIDHGRAAQLRARWFTRDPAWLLVVLALWPAAQVHPTSMMFGNGRLESLVEILPKLLSARMQERLLSFDAADFVLAEALAVAAATLAAGLALAALTRPGSPRARLVLGLIGAAVATKSFAYGIKFGPDQIFVWATPGAVGGLSIGMLALLAAAGGPPKIALRLAVLSALVLIAVVNLAPENPYHAHWITQFRPGRLANFNAAAQWLAAAWPHALLAGLLLHSITGTAQAQSRPSWP